MKQAVVYSIKSSIAPENAHVGEKMENFMHQGKSWKPLMALIGARPSLTLSAYLDSIMMLIIYFMASLVGVLAIILEVDIGVMVVQHPLKEILPWLQHYGLDVFYIIVFTFAASFVVYMETRRAAKHMIGLVVLTRAHSDQLPPMSLSDYIGVSMPPWLKSLPLVDLPDEMLDTLQREINPEEPWMKNLAAYLRQYAPEHSPSISILVSLRDCVTISVVGSNGKCEEITVTQEQTAALIGFLALREKGVWMLRKHIIQPIYGLTFRLK